MAETRAGMKVLVLGATGGTGRLVLQRLLAEGHQVTAFARNPAAVPTAPGLRVAKGEARDRASLEAALEGQQAVISTFGPRSLRRDDLHEALMRNLVPAMERGGVQRLVNLSAWGAGDSAATAGLLFAVIRATVLRNVYADKNRAEQVLFQSRLAWVNPRPGRLLDGPARGNVRASADGKGIKAELTREDLAAFLVAQLSQDVWLRASPVVGY